MKHAVISDVALTIQAHLKRELQGTHPALEVRVGDLRDIPPRDSEQTGVNLFIHSVVVNENGPKASPRREHREKGEGGQDVYIFHPPAVPLTVYFVLTPYANDWQVALQLLGRLIQLFQETPAVSGKQLKGVCLPRTEKLAFSADTRLDSERLGALFQRSGAPFRLSIGYLTRTVILSDKIVRKARPTRELSSEVASLAE